jgi:predicted metal-dependent hydrolase
MTDTERSSVRFGLAAIPYTVQRGRRQKTIAIAVDSAEGVRVRAPQHTPISKLDAIVLSKATWITERQRRFEDLPPRPTPREFVSGETFLYAGKQYRLKRVRAVPEAVRLVGGRIEVRANADARMVLIAWYRQRAQERLEARVPLLAELIGVAPRKILVREQRTRWGSADANGHLRFNWRIVQAPTRLLDYVAAHELVHLLHADHTRDFWATLGRVMPDYEVRRERLRTLGRAMVW